MFTSLIKKGCWRHLEIELKGNLIWVNKSLVNYFIDVRMCFNVLSYPKKRLINTNLPRRLNMLVFCAGRCWYVMIPVRKVLRLCKILFKILFEVTL